MTKEILKSVLIKHKVDIIVVASLLLLSLAVMLTVNLTRKPGAFVEITVDGAVVGEYPLDVDEVYELNGGTNTLTVKDGAAYMTYSNCPDHTCENTGKVQHVGQTIVCLPNKLTVTVKGEATDDSVDLVS
jgi:hypothetical protein